MNIQRLKKSTNALFLFFGLLVFSSCDAQNKTTVIEILTGKEIENAGYIYSDGSPNSMGSRGFPHSSEGTANVNNIKITGKGVTHGNIQTKAETNIQNIINTRLDGYE